MTIPVLILARIQYTPKHLRWGCFVHAFHPERLRRPTKGPVVPLPGTEKPGIASFSAISQTPLRLLPYSLHRFLSPPPRPILSPGAAPQFASPCFQRAAASDGSLPTAASNI